MHTLDELRDIARRCGLDVTVAELAHLDAYFNRTTGDRFLAMLESLDDDAAVDRWADDGGRAP